MSTSHKFSANTSKKFSASQKGLASPKFLTEAGLAPIFIVILITTVALVGGYLVFTNYSNNRTKVNLQPTPKPPPTSNIGTISGNVISKSDVQTIPDSPLQKALVLLIPENKINLFLEDLDLDKDSKDSLARLRPTELSKELFGKYVESSAVSAQDGKYTINIAPGTYWLCLANLDPSIQHTLPASLNGCNKVNISEDERTLNILWGEGGLTTR